MESAAVPPVSGDPGQAPGGQRAEVEGRERTVIWEGLPLGPSVTERWAEVQDFPARPDDILIATYPKAEVQDFTARPVDILIDTYTKAGTTWVVEMVDAVLSQGDLTHCFRAPSHNRAPFLELNPPLPSLCALDILKTLPSPRMIKTHLPIRLVPQSFWDNDCKAVYVARNAKDCMVSYYHFQRMNLKIADPGSWEEYFDSFLAGEVPWGSWFDHVMGWWRDRQKHQILYLFYEDMKEDPAREISRLSRFLGKGLDQSQIDRIVDHTSFSSMKDNPMANYSTVPSVIFNQSVSPFMRKGTVGDWKNVFTVSQNERFEEEYRRLMTDPSLTFRTEL